MANKTCVVNRDQDGNPSVVLVKNIKFNLGDQVLDFLVSEVGISEPLEISETDRTNFDIMIENNKIGHIEVKSNGTSEVQVTHSALETGIDNSDENQNKNMDAILSNFSPEVAKYLKKNNTNIVENKGKGIGKQSYIVLGNLLANKYGKTLVSDSSRTDEAEGMWNSLYRNGMATIRGEYNTENRSSYLYEFKPTEQVDNSQSVTEWFGDSKAVDESGNPKTVYHVGEFKTEFTRKPTFEGTDDSNYGIFFSDSMEAMRDYENTWAYKNKKVVKVNLKLENPFVIDVSKIRPGDKFTEHFSDYMTERFKNENIGWDGDMYLKILKEAREQGHDGVIFENTLDPSVLQDTYVVFDPSQIKILNNVATNPNSGYIPSQLFEQIKQLPFVTSEQALDVYKNIYKKSMSNWQNSSNTENTNSETGEPLLFFKSDNGKVYSDLTETLKNSASSYSTGFMNDSMEFESFLETPVYNNKTVQGKVQEFMKNEYLKALEKSPNTYEATDTMSAEYVEEDLSISMPFSFERNGNNFTITEQEAEKEFDQLVKEVGVKDAVDIAMANKYLELKNKTIQPKDVVYNENQLYNAIQSFMKRMGISETTISDYVDKYKAKFGIEPDAKAFIDINRKLIATATGEATLDELSEEVSHFIIDAWSQDEITRLLPYVKNTSHYAQFAETYRDIYGKQISDPVLLERYVEKEILGKMLAESMRNGFTLENKTELERNFFQKLGDILKNFVNFIQSKITQKEVNDIEFFNTQVKNMLFNQELDNRIENFNPTSDLQLMYAVPENMERLLNRFGKDIKANVSNQVEEEIAIQGALSIFNDRLSRASALLKEVRKYSGDNNGIIPSDISLLTEAVLKDREALELLKTASIRTAKSSSETIGKVNLIQQIADATLRTISDLSGEIQSTSDRDPVIVAQELLNEIGENREYVRQAVEESIENKDQNGVRQLAKDTNKITRLFGNVGKMSNAFVTILSSIVKKLHNDAITDTNDDFNKFATKLIPFRNLLNKFYKGGNFISVVDADKVRESKLKYEYKIRTDIGDTTLENMTEAEFIEDYDNITKVEKGTPTYYAYDYAYKKAYSNQDWAEQGRTEYNDKFIENVEKIADLTELKEGRNAMYNYLKNISDRRTKYREGDPLRKSENQDIIEDRRRRSNIFEKDGSLKEGLSYIRYSEAMSKINKGEITEDEITSTNPKNAPGVNDFVVVIDRAEAKVEGELAFQLLKWNQINLSAEGDADVMKNNFTEAYAKKLESLQNLSYAERNKILKEWVTENLQFDMTDEYWEGLDPENTNYEALRKIAPQNVVQTLNKKEAEMNVLRLRKNNILKVYKLIGDYKEIDAEKIPSDDKLLLENLEIEASRVRKEIQQIFDDYSVPMYKVESDPIVELNQSFYDVFQKSMGVRYESSTIDQKKIFFSGQNGMSAEKYSMFLNFEKSLSRTQSLGSVEGKIIERYKKLAKDPSNKDSIKEAYLKSMAPAWYRRYDANTEYGNFTRDLNNGALNVEELVDEYIKNDSFVYNGDKLKMMQITPSFKYTLAREASTEELYEEYQNTDNLKTKFDLLMKMGGVDRLKNVAKEDLGWITSNEENLKAYVYMMDYHLNSLKNNKSLTSYNIFLRPQQRKGSLERYETFVTKGDKMNQLKDSLKERFQYREDDFIDAYRDGQIPKYGMYRVKPEELTDDILGSLIWFNKQSNVYKNKVLNYSRAMRAVSALEHQNFDKGKKATDTNYHKIMKEMIDYNFFGKTTTMKMETNILGQKVDMAKVLMWFRGFAIKQALGFSSIAALTNVTAGITQNQFLKWTGKNIYSDADNRALGMIAPLTSDSIKDIGDFNPTSKLNKLLYSFGVYNIEDRFRNAKFNKTARVLPEAAFGMMAVGNFAMQSRVTLSKLMEIRLVDGKFQSWRDFYLDQKRIDKTQTDSQIKSKFNDSKSKSMFDYLNDQGEFIDEKLKQDGYNGDIKMDKSRAMSRIQDIAEQVTMEIKNHNEGQAARSPIWSFALSLKKWLILANTNMFSRKRLDPESGGHEEGLIYSYKYMLDIIQRARKENIGLAQAYDGLEEYEKKNVRATGIITASMITLLTLAFMLKKLADDDDEKDNYGLQLANYMLLRNLNETFSANVGVGNSMYEALQSPLSSISTLTNLTKVMNVSDIGEDTTRGKYKGVDKYVANWIKLTSAKNIFTVKDAETVFETRKGYEFFSAQNSLYHIFSMLPKKDKEEE